MMKRGSITVFTALSMMLIASLLFVLLEEARVYGLESYAGMKTDTGVESACAAYQPLLWQNYGILLLDGAYGTDNFSVNYVAEEIRNNLEANLEWEDHLVNQWKTDLFRLKENSVTVSGYQLITDQQGEIFLNLIAECMKETLPVEVAEKIYDGYAEGHQVEKGAQDVSESIEDAEKRLEEERGREEEERKKNGKEEEEEKNVRETLPPEENPLEIVKVVNRNTVLNLVIGDTSAISSKTVRMETKLSNRKKEQGTIEEDKSTDWYRKILVQEYLEQYFSCYTRGQEDHFLDYEMEYVLGGKGSEIENLEAVVNRLLLIREAANVTCLLGDQDKMNFAETLARIIGALAVENEAVVQVVKIAIVGAWAYLESILDVRSLLAGEKIPLIKDKREWTTDVGNLLGSFQQSVRAKNCDHGLFYTDYLKQMIFFMENEDIAYRMMDVMECSLQSNAEYKNCKMDHMLVKLCCEICYEASPLFSQLSLLGQIYRGKYSFSNEKEFSYIP